MDAYIYEALRSPRGRAKPEGGLHLISASALSAQVIDAVLDRHLDAQIEDLLWGTVTQIDEQGGCLARAAVLASRLPVLVPGLSLNRFCASGLEAVNLAAVQLAAGEGTAYLAGGVEMMSRVPMGSDGAAIASDPSLALRHHFLPQGIAADLIATREGFSRETLDAYAIESQRRTALAQKEGRFDRSLVPIVDCNGLPLLSQDEHPRPQTDREALARLSPAFEQIGRHEPGFDRVALQVFPELEAIEHSHHAGNSSGLVDGAAAVLLGTKEFGTQTGKAPRAQIRAMAKVGTNPTLMLDGPLTAIQKVLNKASMSISDIDLFEVNEAFAAIPLMVLKHFDIDPARVNPNGGAIALGHPLGATGAMLLGTVLDELERRDLSVGLVTLCVAGGMGVATIIERV